jgi:hypothetical protein
MKRTRVLAVVSWAAVLGALGGAYALAVTYGFPRWTPVLAFLDADILVKLCMMLCLGIAVTVLVIAAGSRGAEAGGAEGVLRALSLVAAGLGVAALLWGHMISEQAARSIGGVSFAVRAPGYAEGLTALALGLLPAALALTFQRRKRANAAPA